MESLGVYRTVTFGNLDAESYSYFDREAVAKIYSDRYNLEGFEREEVTMHFENVTIVPDELRK